MVRVAFLRLALAAVLPLLAACESPPDTNTCDNCHGGDGESAPPLSVARETSTDVVGVGAHRAHLGPSEWHATGVCDDCHVVPDSVDDRGHLDPLPAELHWSPRARSSSADPRWDGARCENYCHGQTLDGALTDPQWTLVDGTQAACGTCHGLPPAGDHPQGAGLDDCARCHGEVIGPDGAFVAPERHVDGVVDAIGLDELACAGACHGSGDDPAPPVDVSGDVATSAVGVGAHRVHLAPSAAFRTGVCADCHHVPGAVDEDGHLGALPAELAWGWIAEADGAPASWDGASCATYCHGEAAPRWTVVDGTQAACGTCHGLPPAGDHPLTSAPCATCHGEVIAEDGAFVRPDLHGDGIVDVTAIDELACAGACHGDGTSAAPPLDVHGSSATTDVGVGAHRAHLDASDWRRSFACLECHDVPRLASDAGHVDTALPAEVSFNGIAGILGVTPTWDGATCVSYCHGATLDGGTNPSPSWTIVDGSGSACGSCHGLPPGGDHPDDPACEVCHAAVIDASGAFVAPALHLDGYVQVNEPPLTCSSCHGDADSPAPPASVTGSVDTTAVGVGAHRAHLAAGSPWRADVLCEDCHLVPAVAGALGHADTALPAELVWSDLAEQDGATPTWDGATCANYCHGQTLSGGSNASPAWTTVDGTQAACGTCHGLPPGPPHTDNLACEGCHDTAGPGLTIAVPSQHIDGVVELVGGLSCTSCHGSGTDPAPPLDTLGNSDPTAPGVGAHAAHAAIDCAECHLVPADLSDVGHADSALPAELTWGPLATDDGAAPAYNGATCTNYCHGQTLSGGSLTAPDWTTVDGTQAACGTCHGLPPSFPHVARTDCETCHDTAGPGGTIAIPDQHVDGVVQLTDGGALTCTSCHGSGTDPAPPLDTLGNSDPAAPGVGAHPAHTGVDCAECHLVPTDIADAGHTDSALPAELTWGPLATKDGAIATYDGATCTNYCHGATLSGGTTPDPDWTTVDGTQTECGSCHGLPPGAPHTTSTACETCHDTAGPGLTIAIPAQHINGTVEILGGQACTSCHASQQGDRRQVVGPGGDFERASHHVDDGSGAESVTDGDCLVCHDTTVHQSLLDPDVILLDPDLGTGDIVYDGTGASLEGFCLGCHDGDGPLALGGFSDGLVPTPIALAWAGASHAADTPAELGEHACLACHGGPDATRSDVTTDQDVHGSTWSGLLSPLVAGVQAANDEEGVCLACHDGAVGADLVSEVAKTYRHPVDDADQVDGRSVECADCHDPHAATAAAPLLGVAGVDIDGLAVIADEPYEVCLKCHGDTYNTADDRAMNLRLAFDPLASSFHPVAAAGRNESEAMGNQLLGGLTVDSRIECADCHNSEATADVEGLASASTAAPQGPHGSTYAYLLRSAYWTDPDAPSNYDAADYDLCYRCHDPTAFSAEGMTQTNFGSSTNNYHDLHMAEEENIGCTNCHYDAHGNAGAENTDYRIDGTVYDAPPFDVKTRGVSFSPDVLKQGTNAEPQWRLEVSTRKRSCYLVCHGETHTLSYTPPGATDDDALTIP